MKTVTALHGKALTALVRDEEQEKIRVEIWPMVPLPARMVAMMAARLPRERASEELTAFSSAERREIAAALAGLAMHLEVVARCMRDTKPNHTTLLH